MKYALLIYQGEKFEQSWEKSTEDERREVYAEHDAFSAGRLRAACFHGRGTLAAFAPDKTKRPKNA